MVHVFEASVWIWQITTNKNGFGSRSSASTLYCTNLEVSTYILTHIARPKILWLDTEWNNKFIPSYTYNDKNPPVSDTVVELRLCRCKTGFIHRRPIRKKNNLLSIEMSLCVKYSNEKSHKEKIDSNSDVDENNDYCRFITCKNHWNP